MAISSNIKDFLNGLSFTGNVRKMRKALMEYFAEEGIKCEIKEGTLIFEYDEDWYVVKFAAGEEYAECGIVFTMRNEEYASLDVSDKTFIAAKVNNEVDNHATMQVYNESIKIVSTFYFTSKKMMLALFLKHFDEMQEAIIAAARLITESIDEMNEQAQEEKAPQKIGFCVQNKEAEEAGTKVSAQKREYDH